MKKALAVVLILVGFYVSFTFGYNLSENQPSLIPQAGSVALTQDPELVKLATKLGIDYSDLNLKQSKTVKADNTGEAEAIFQPPNTIVIRQDSDQKLELLAHEYMHFYSSQYSQKDVDMMVENYRLYHSKNQWVQTQLEPYKCDEVCLSDEANAYLCTAYYPYRLSDNFNQYCDSVIPNRSVLFSY